MPPYSDERTPLLPASDYSHDDVHDQFCQLTGVPPSDLPAGAKWKAANRSLYERAVQLRSKQSFTYHMTAATANTLLLAQVVIGAAVTGIGSSKTENIHTIITLLGAANTIIAGLVAYLKSRGQPMRARMFRDDLERVVDEIENSEVMWLGIAKNVNGYDDIDTEDQVTVRSEVARLTRLYDKAVRNSTLNNPDLYGTGDGHGMTSATLRDRSTAAPQPAQLPPGPATAPAPVTAPATGTAESAPEPQAEPVQPTPLAADPDESPATAKPTVPTAVKLVVGAEPVKNAEKDSGKDGAATKGEAGKDEDAKKEDGEAAKDGDKDATTEAGKKDENGKGKNGKSADVTDGSNGKGKGKEVNGDDPGATGKSSEGES